MGIFVLGFHKVINELTCYIIFQSQIGPTLEKESPEPVIPTPQYENRNNETWNSRITHQRHNSDKSKLSQQKKLYIENKQFSLCTTCGLIFFLTLILIGFSVLAVVYVVFLQSFYIALIWIGLALILIGFIGLAVYFKKGGCDKSVSQSDIGVGKPGISIPKYA